MNKINNANQLKQMISKSKKIALFWHTSPDGDAIWAMLWFWNILKKLNKSVSYFTPTKPENLFNFIGEISKIKTEFDYWNYDILIFLDFTPLSRINKFFAGHEDYFQKKISIQIDHHLETEESRINLAIKDSESISTCEIIFEYTHKIRPELFDSNISTHLYMWITTDSGNFRHEKNSIRTFKNATKLLKLWANKKEIIDKIYNTQSIWSIQILQRILQRMIIKNNFIYSYCLQEDLDELNIDSANSKKVLEIMLSIKECDVVLLIKTDETQIKWSFRWKGKYDCTKIANIFWWWWHFNAAGFAIPKENNFEIQKNNILKQINHLINLD